MNDEKTNKIMSSEELDDVLPKYEPIKLSGKNLGQNYVSAFNTGMNIYQCVNYLQGNIDWTIKAVNDVVKSWNTEVSESIDQSKAIVRETTTEQFNTEWTNKQPELIEQVNTLTTNQFNEDWGILENRINTTLETQDTNIQNIQNEQNELETNTNNKINEQNTEINSIQTQQTNLANEQTTLSNRMDTFTSLSEGSTTGDAELRDIRVGANGVTYNNAGDAVRGQYSQLKEDLVNLEGADGLPYYIPLEDLEMQNGFYNRDSTTLTESEWYRTFYYRLKPHTKYVLKVSYDNITQRVYDDFRIIKEDGTILYYAYNLAGKGTREIEWVSPDNGYYLTITVKVGQTGSIKEYGGSIEQYIDKKDIAIFIGDSYTQANSLGENDRNKRFSTIVSNRLNLIEKNFAVGGMGYVTGATTYSQQLDNAISDTSFKKSKVKYVFINGGRNDGADIPFMDTTYTNAVKNTVQKAIDNYPNARVIIIPMMWDYTNIISAIYPIYQTIIYACQTLDCVIIPMAYSWLTGYRDFILSDNVHPNVDGHNIIANHICNALKTGNYNAFPQMLKLEPSSNIETNGYFTIHQENGFLTFNSYYYLNNPIPSGTTLFSITVNGTRNVPAYIGDNILQINIQDHDRKGVATLNVQCVINDNGYTVTVKNNNYMEKGEYKLFGDVIPFALKQSACVYSGTIPTN